MESQRVWVAHETDGYVVGKVVDIQTDIVTIRIDFDGSTIKVDYDSVFPITEDYKQDVDDNCEFALFKLIASSFK